MGQTPNQSLAPSARCATNGLHLAENTGASNASLPFLPHLHAAAWTYCRSQQASTAVSVRQRQPADVGPAAALACSANIRTVLSKNRPVPGKQAAAGFHDVMKRQATLCTGALMPARHCLRTWVYVGHVKLIHAANTVAAQRCTRLPVCSQGDRTICSTE